MTINPLSTVSTDVLKDALANQRPINDTGNNYSNVSNAVSNASSWVFVPAGSYNESFSVSTSGITIVGAGPDTRIYDSLSAGNSIVTISASDVKVQNCRVENTGGGSAWSLSAADPVIHQCYCFDFGTGRHVVYGKGGAKRATITENVFVQSAQNGDDAISSSSTNDHKWVVSDNTILNPGRIAINSFSATDNRDWIIANNYIENAASSGISVEGHDCIVIGNRVHTCDDIGIGISGTDVIVANNRVSDSTNADISDSGTGTVLDSNATGTAN